MITEKKRKGRLESYPDGRYDKKVFLWNKSHNFRNYTEVKGIRTKTMQSTIKNYYRRVLKFLTNEAKACKEKKSFPCKKVSFHWLANQKIFAYSRAEEIVGH